MQRQQMTLKTPPIALCAAIVRSQLLSGKRAAKDLIWRVSGDTLFVFADECVQGCKLWREEAPTCTLLVPGLS